MLIYKITNTVNGKVCVGKTFNALEQRRGEHFKAARKATHRANLRLANQAYWDKKREVA